MSNNLIRKGLAIAAAVSMTLVGFVGVSAPANANATNGNFEYLLAPSVGTSLSVPSNMAFVLDLRPNTGTTGTDATKLKLRIDTNPSNAGYAMSYVTTDTLVRAVAGSKDSTKTAAIANNDADGISVVAVTGTANTRQIGLTVDSAESKTTYRATVQVWEDTNGDNLINGIEYISAPVTVEFTKLTDITWGVALGAANPTTENAVRTATVTSSANTEMMHANESIPTANTAIDNLGGSQLIAVRWSEAPAASSTFTAVQTLSVSRNGTTFALTSSVNRSIDVGETLRAQVLFNRDDASKTSVASFNLDRDVVATANFIQTSGTNLVATGGLTQVTTPTTANSVIATDAKIRLGASSFQASTDVTPFVAGARVGIPVTFTIKEETATSLDPAASITAGGKTLKNTNNGTVQEIEVVVLTVAHPTDATLGRAILDLSASGIDEDDSITIQVSANGVTGATGARVFDFVAANIAKVENTNASGGAAIFAKDAVVALTFGVTDQWAQPITGSQYSVRATHSGNNLTAPVVNGVATVNWPAFSALGTKAFTAQGLKSASTTGQASASSFNIFVGTADAAASISVVGTAVGTGLRFGVGTDADLELNTNAFVAGDTRIGQAAAQLARVGGVTVSGVVRTASATGARTTVTLAGAGLDFEVTVNGGTLYAKNSVTIATDDGSYSVKVVSNFAGAKTLTVSSGSVSVSQPMVFAASAITAATGDVLTVTSPKSAKSGRVVEFAVKLVDRFGSPKAATDTVTVTYSGPGFVISTPTAFTAAGLAPVRVLLSAGDLGRAIVTVSVYNTTATKLTASSATWIGPVANAKAGAKKGRVIIEAYRAKGKTVSVFVGSTRVASYVSNKANFSKVVRGIRTGDRNVRVVLSGPGEDFRGVITVK